MSLASRPPSPTRLCVSVLLMLTFFAWLLLLGAALTGGAPSTAQDAEVVEASQERAPSGRTHAADGSRQDLNVP